MQANQARPRHAPGTPQAYHKQTHEKPGTDGKSVHRDTCASRESTIENNAGRIKHHKQTYERPGTDGK